MGMEISASFDRWVSGMSHGAGKEFEDEWLKAGDVLYGRTQELVHVVTGNLKASSDGPELEESQPGKVVVKVEYDAPYAEAEHDRGGSHAWLRLAAVDTEDTFREALGKAWGGWVRSWK